MMWDIFENRLFITAELVAKTGMRVGGGGQAAEPAASDLPVMKTVDGRPFIPGSSLRGVLRSHIERIVRTLEDVGEGKGACYPLDEETRCVRKDQIDRWEKERFERLKREIDVVEHLAMAQSHDLERASWIWTKTCRVCQVFGSPWLASRVRVSDLPCLNGAEAETRDAVAIDRDKETVANKYDFEALPVDTRFRLEIIADNLAETERGLLWLGVEELRRSQILVGGFKGRGLGRVKLDNLEVSFVEGKKGLRDYLLTGELIKKKLTEANSWFEKLVNELTGG